MFDDVQSNNQGQVPPNLPVGEPEDMFADADPAGEIAAQSEPARPSTSSSQEVAPEMPSTALGAGVLRPKQNAPVTPTSRPPVTPSRVSEMPPAPPAGGASDQYRITEPSIGKGILLTVIIVVVAIILGGGGWFLYQRYIANPVAETDTFQETPPVTDATGTEDVTTSPSDQNNTSTDLETDIIDDQLLFGEPIDTDGDGLDDAKEGEIGTDANNWDSDSDGLSDRDEAVIWKTDPNNPDTDGDTYFDGLEVKSGYNPLGDGKLFTPPTSTPQ